MSIEANKHVVREWVRRWNAGDADAVAALYHEDGFSWRISGISPVSQKYSRDEIVEIIRATFARPMQQPHNIEMRYLTAEEDRVSLEFIGRAVFADGTEFVNYYHTLFFIRDGKIAKGRAYLDTWVAAQSQMKAPGTGEEA